VSTLYVALGFLKWFDSDQSAEPSFAPLVLVPVTMTRAKGRDGYLLLGRDDDIVVNVSLREKLRESFDIELPDFPDDEQWTPSAYLRKTAKRVSRQRRWEVESDSMGLGFFTFSKFMMWRDLDPGAWPEGLILDHELLNILLGDNTQFESQPPLVADDEPVDHRIDISKSLHVVDADSSQAVVIEETNEGRNLVVQGPPGTGKSQTITNIIAAAAHSGKTVLFVAEKTAALDVVHDRLQRAGLGVLCLEMHSRKSNKREVIRSLDESLRLSVAPRGDVSVSARLASCRDKLNGWSKALHQPVGKTGRSSFDVIGAQLKLRADNVRLLEERFDAAANWDAEKLASVEAATDRTCAALLKLKHVPKEHPWFGTNIGPQSPFDLERLAAKLKDADEKLVGLKDQLARILSHVTGDSDPSLSDAFAIIKAFRHIASVPEKCRVALDTTEWVNAVGEIENAIELGRRHTALCKEINSLFHRDAWNIDTQQLLSTLRGDGPSFFRRLHGRYRRAASDFQAIHKNRPPKRLQERIGLLESLQAAQERGHEYLRIEPLLSSALGPLWRGLETSWDDARTLAAWVRVAHSEFGGARLITLAARSQDVGVFADFADHLAKAAEGAQYAFDQVCEEGPFNSEVQRRDFWR
jgi:hypothetical protein